MSDDVLPLAVRVGPMEGEGACEVDGNVDGVVTSQVARVHQKVMRQTATERALFEQSDNESNRPTREERRYDAMEIDRAVM